MAEEFKISLGIQLNDSQLQNVRNQLNTLQDNTYRVRIDLDTDRVQRQINSIRRQIENLGRIRINLGGDIGSGRGNNGRNGGFAGFDTQGIHRTVAEVNRAYNDLRNLQNRINSIRIQIGGLDSSKNSSQIIELSGQLNRLMADYNNLYHTFNNRFSTDQLDNLSRSFETTSNKVSALNAKVEDARRNLANEITIKLNTNKFNSEVASLESKFNKLENESGEISAGMSRVRKALEEMNVAARTNNIDALISANEKYEHSLKEVQNQLSINLKAQQEVNNAQKLLNDKNNLSLQMDVWLRDNSAAASEFGSRIRQLQTELKTCDSTRLTGIKSEFQQITKQANLAGKATLTFADRFKNEFSKLSTYFSASAVILQTTRALSSMYDNVVKIDTALTELKKVTNETNSAYDSFLKNAGNDAKEIGTTIDGIVSSTADFARLGHGFTESQELAKVANIYAVVGDEIADVNEATEHLVSTTAAYGEEIDAMNIIDKFNEIGNNFAISSGGIGEALERSASSMKAANNTLDETIALITAANTVVQDADVVGTAFKTISMRIRGATTELEEAGLETDGMVESTAKLQEEIKALSGVDIMLNDNEFKSTYQIMEELANKWQDLTDIQQASITELIAGRAFCQNVQKCA